LKIARQIQQSSTVTALALQNGAAPTPRRYFNKGTIVVPQLTRRAGRVSLAVTGLSLFPAALFAASLPVAAGGDLQAAINTAQPGDHILLAAGATYTGNFTLPAKAGTAFITIRTDSTRLPGPGVRIRPDDAAQLAKLKSPNGSPALATTAGAHHWRIENVEFPATVGGVGDIVTLGSSAQTDVSQMPSSIVLDRVYIHGDPAVGQKRGIALNSGYTEIVNSYIADIKAAGIDSQAICGWNGSGPYLIENNYLEAAGENVMFGGADPKVWNLVPADITLRRNVLAKPVAWRNERWSVKNLFELKNARRVLVEGNVLENIWLAGQAGFAVQLTPRNQDGKAPWSTVEDVTFRYNVIRHASSGFNLSGWDDLQSSGQLQRVQITNNLLYDVDGTRWGGVGIFVQLGNSPRSITIERNTIIHSGTVVSVYGTKGGAPWVIDGFAFRNNLTRHNTYGVKGAGLGTGQSTLTAYFSDLVFDRNVLAGGSASLYPAGNFFPAEAEFMAMFVNVAGEDFSLVPGSAFARQADDGGPLGANMTRLNAALRGSVSESSEPASEGSTAVCRPGLACPTPNPFSHQRP
jgi:hypothetical protein